MGITGLLPFLEKASRPCHISEFRGGTVAVDAYCWLHKGAHACAEQLARGEDNQMYVRYCMKYVKMLLSYDIHPIMVFDGRNLPAKADTEKKRRESRQKAKQRAAEFLRLGKTEEARIQFRQCVDITPAMAHNLIKECRNIGVDCIVAPYESDAQLAFFNIKGCAEVVITEDSDLILFGCSKVFYKLDLAGSGKLVEADKIYLSMEMRPDQYTIDKFRYTCILSGCDYVSSLQGIGLKKAQKFMTLTAETDPEKFLNKIPRYLKKNHLTITDEYKRNVMTANATFLHQTVFDPFKKKLVPLTDMDTHGTNPEHCVNCGDIFDHEKAYQVAIGNLNPYSLQRIDNWHPSSNISQYSIWSGFYKKRTSRALQKELGKKQMQNFLSSEPEKSSLSAIPFKSMKDTHSTDIIVEEVVNEETINEDIKREREEIFQRMEFYKNITTIEEDVVPSRKEERSSLSPVINKNPFLVKKQLSKFPRTETNLNVVTTSSFFSTNKSIQGADQDEKPSNISLCNVTEIETESLSQTSNAENINNTNISHEEETEIVQVAKKKCIEYITSDSVNCIQVSEQESESLTNSQKTISFTQKHSSQTNNKKNLGTCRRVGLSKKSLKCQPTLHSFFTGSKKD